MELVLWSNQSITWESGMTLVWLLEHVHEWEDGHEDVN